ncbi:MAG: hypothetical protein AB7D43_11280 [Sulfurimonadaceae bacterium]
MKENLIEQFISQKRIGSYVDMDEYITNLTFSKSSYIPLSILEIALRNAINRFLSYVVGEQWYEDTNFLTQDSIRKVEEAKNVLQSRRENLSKDKIIAELSFGFWVNLFKKPYDKKLRIKELKKIFPNLPSANEKLINREVLFRELNHIRNFRNRVFHYEKVINKDNYNNVHDEIFEILSYFDNELKEFALKVNEL